MSNRLFQNVIHQMYDVAERHIGVIDESGIVIASSDPAKMGETKQRVREELSYSSNSVIYDKYTYRSVNAANKNDVIVFVEGDDKHAAKIAEMLAITIGNIKSLYDEKYDKVSFLKNIILDNILPSDIYLKSNELHFNDATRAVVIVKFQNNTATAPYEIIQSLVPDKNKDYVIGISEQDIVIIKEVSRETTSDELELYAKELVKTVAKEHSAKLLVGISSLTDSLKDLARAYKEARISLEVGKVFDVEKNIMSYGNLGIGRLIYQLPVTLCEIFLGEVFEQGSLESLDRETLMTVQCFFENNLNVSETSRKLFVHRNTLVYRLEKIRKLTGLDLREFEHAVTFKVALMVKRYLTSKPIKF